MGVSSEDTQFLDNDGLSDDDVPEEAHKALLNAVSQLYKKQRIDAPKRREAAQQISEFNLTSNKEVKSNKVNVHELLKDLKQKVTHKEINKKVLDAQKKSKTLPKPLEKNESEKVQREVGYSNVKKNLDKWNTIVERNRLASQLTFPLEQKEARSEPPNFLTTFEKPSELEKAMAAVLNKSETAQEERQLEDDLSKLTVGEMIERRRMMAKMKARESYRIAKAARQNKIKSKKYHRILKRERIKQALIDFEKLQKTDPEAALEKLEQIERARAEERISLRHRNTGKWAKSQAIRAKYNTEARIQLAEQLAKSRDLTRKTKNNESSTDGDDESDDEGSNDDETHTEIPTSSDISHQTPNSRNPWINEYTNFLKGANEFIDKSEKNLEQENDLVVGNKKPNDAVSSSDNINKEIAPLKSISPKSTHVKPSVEIDDKEIPITKENISMNSTKLVDSETMAEESPGNETKIESAIPKKFSKKIETSTNDNIEQKLDSCLTPKKNTTHLSEETNVNIPQTPKKGKTPIKENNSIIKSPEVTKSNSEEISSGFNENVMEAQQIDDNDASVISSNKNFGNISKSKVLTPKKIKTPIKDNNITTKSPQVSKTNSEEISSDLDGSMMAAQQTDDNNTPLLNTESTIIDNNLLNDGSDISSNRSFGNISKNKVLTPKTSPKKIKTPIQDNNLTTKSPQVTKTNSEEIFSDLDENMTETQQTDDNNTLFVDTESTAIENNLLNDGPDISSNRSFGNISKNKVLTPKKSRKKIKTPIIKSHQVTKSNSEEMASDLDENVVETQIIDDTSDEEASVEKFPGDQAKDATVVTNSGQWNIIDAGCSKKKKLSSHRSGKRKLKEKSLDDLFDEAEEAIQNHTLSAVVKLKSDLETRKRVDIDEKRKETEINVNKRPRTVNMRDIDVALVEFHEEGISSGINDLKLLKDKLSSNEKPVEKEPKIDPNKHIKVKTRKLLSEIGDLEEDDDDDSDDNQETQKTHLMEAFADDDIAADFRKEKKGEEKKNQAEEINLEMPGWGSWGGTSIVKKSNKRKNRRFIIRMPSIPRRDENKPAVIINEDPVPQFRNQLVSELPYPFTSVKDYEASIRAPVGKNWVPEKAHKKLTALPVVTKMGTIIEPMSNDVATSGNKRKRKIKMI